MRDAPTQKEKNYEPIRVAELQLCHDKWMWLEKYGWKYTCDYIDSYWRYSKTIDSKLMTTRNIEEAIRIELDFVTDKENEDGN